MTDDEADRLLGELVEGDDYELFNAVAGRGSTVDDVRHRLTEGDDSMTAEVVATLFGELAYRIDLLTAEVRRLQRIASAVRAAEKRRQGLL
jgi:hypothetical protein